MIASILNEYGIRFDECHIETLTSGLINSTWKVTYQQQQYIAQRINDNVFKDPYKLAANLRMLDQYLVKHSPGYLFVAPIKSSSNEEIIRGSDSGYYRLFPFVRGSHTINVVATPDQAFEASLQFGKFTRLLADFDTSKLNLTIPDFHNLTLRYRQFEAAIKNGNPERIKRSGSLITEIVNHKHILDSFERIKSIASIRIRVTHNDTKISNVLFNDQGKGICIIDLDTVMPGYFISDVGDMMRTYLSPANEEEKDFSKIEVREDFFQAIVQGYLSSMRDALAPEEKDLVLYAGFFLIYMQAIRFLTDYCNNDLYYGARYDDQNFVRAGNQIHLLKKLEDKKNLLQEIITTELRE